MINISKKKNERFALWHGLNAQPFCPSLQHVPVYVLSSVCRLISLASIRNLQRLTSIYRLLHGTTVLEAADMQCTVAEGLIVIRIIHSYRNNELSWKRGSLSSVWYGRCLDLLYVLVYVHIHNLAPCPGL